MARARCSSRCCESCRRVGTRRSSCIRWMPTPITTRSRAWPSTRCPPEGPLVVLGESFSGPIAIRLAAALGPRLQALMLCCSFARKPRAALSRLGGLINWLPAPGALPASVSTHVLLGGSPPAESRRLLADALVRLPAEVLRAAPHGDGSGRLARTGCGERAGSLPSSSTGPHRAAIGRGRDPAFVPADRCHSPGGSSWPAAGRTCSLCRCYDLFPGAAGLNMLGNAAFTAVTMQTCFCSVCFSAGPS